MVLTMSIFSLLFLFLLVFDQVRISPAHYLHPGSQRYWAPAGPAFGCPELADTDQRRSPHQGIRPPWLFLAGSWWPHNDSF